MPQPVPTEDSDAGSVGTAMSFIAEFNQNVAIFTEAFNRLQGLEPTTTTEEGGNTTQVDGKDAPVEEAIPPMQLIEIREVAKAEALDSVKHLQGDIIRLNTEIARIYKSIEPLSGLLTLVTTLLSKSPYYGTADSEAITDVNPHSGPF